MEQSYSVTICGQQAGKVIVQRQGLYYLFSCRCRLSGDMMYRLSVTCGAQQESLGILIPKDGNFMLETKVPVKRIGEGEMSFILIPKQVPLSGTFVPISPEEPFAYISRLKKSFLVYKNGQVGILIDKMQEQ